jgi:hypothetical protein
MKRSFALVCLLAAAIGVLLPLPADAQNLSPLAGVWTLNRSLSESPPEIGFNVNWIPSSARGGENPGSSGGGRGRRGSGGGGGGGSDRGSAGSFPVSRESYEDARRVQLITGEARNPPVRLMIVDTADAVTITNELGQSRTLHPNGKAEAIELQGVSFTVTTKRDGDRLVVVYRIEQDREVRYTYSRSATPSQLMVDVQFLEHGAGDKARRVYEPGVDTAPRPSPPDVTTRGSTRAQSAEAFDGRPGAELRGLTTLGILVEDLSTRAVACGLNHDAIEAALSKRLADGGFTVRKNSDEDTYVYVNVMTTTLPDGTCVSRYDAFLYTHATTKLSYREQPVLVQVSLMHRGGLGSSAAAAHPAAVARGLENYVDLFVTQIRDANK